jgi:hypothetical protein
MSTVLTVVPILNCMRPLLLLHCSPQEISRILMNSQLHIRWGHLQTHSHRHMSVVLTVLAVLSCVRFFHSNPNILGPSGGIAVSHVAMSMWYSMCIM